MISKLICIAIFTFTVNGQLQGCPWPGMSDYMEVYGVGNLNRTFQVNETLTYRCTEGRQMPIEQNATIVCRANGDWSKPVPQCCKYRFTEDYFLNELNFGSTQAGILLGMNGT
jgi:hypothetical protein